MKSTKSAPLSENAAKGKSSITSTKNQIGNVANVHLIEANFKPRARLLAQLGDQLIKNESIALIELVKNAYDADALTVDIKMNANHSSDINEIVISDDGCGMSTDTIVNVWLEPGSDFKAQQIKENIFSKKFFRLPIGEKGIGRFGVHKLGKVIEMTTKTSNDKEVYVSIDWTKLEDYTYLKDVPVTIHERNTPEVFLDGATGTKIEIRGLRKKWTRGSVRAVNRAISSLSSPFSSIDSFQARFEAPEHEDWIKDILNWEDIKENALYNFNLEIDGNEIVAFEYNFTPWPTMPKLIGRVVGLDNALVEENLTLRKPSEKKGKNVVDFLISLTPYKIGKVRFEGYIFDQDTFILNLGVADKKGFKDYLKENGGIRVFRDGLRVYDYGEPENDWLQLDHRRFQAPTRSISNNLIVGAIYLDRNTSTDLEEKTNREGFVENEAYLAFRDAILHAITTIEFLRFPDKKKLRDEYGPTPKSEPVMHVLAEAKLYAENNIKDARVRERIVDYLGKIEFDYKYMTETLLKAAGAGLTLSVVVHEVEKIIDEVYKILKSEVASDRVLDLVKHLSSLVDGYAGIIQKSKHEKLDIKKVIDQALFNTEYRLKSHHVEVVKAYQNREKSILLLSKAFLGSSLINLIDNSIYWLERKFQKEESHERTFSKKLYIDIVDEDNLIHLLFADNGNGFTVPTDNLTQPFMSTKPDGIGLGLHIVNEVMKAQGGILSFPDFNDFEIPNDFQSGAIIALTFKK